jgi:transposase
MYGPVLDADARVQAVDRSLLTLHRTNEVARHLSPIPSVDPAWAIGLPASVADPRQFRSHREFAAWLGLTPLQSSSGGKERLDHISKRGACYLRELLVIGAKALIRHARHEPNWADPWLLPPQARKPSQVVWAIMARGEASQAGNPLNVGGVRAC